MYGVPPQPPRTKANGHCVIYNNSNEKQKGSINYLLCRRKGILLVTAIRRALHPFVDVEPTSQVTLIDTRAAMSLIQNSRNCFFNPTMFHLETGFTVRAASRMTVAIVSIASSDGACL